MDYNLDRFIKMGAKRKNRMRTKFRWVAVLAFLLVLTAAIFVGCTQTPGDDPGTGDQPGTEDPDNPGGGDPTDPEKTQVDLVLFIGQSNMAGRGDAVDATVVAEGHAFEFRAISDPTKLYPLTEPFGATENNSESGVSESKKSGSLVSAFCESYYAQTQTPIVAVSCAQGGTGINFWDTNRPAYEDACSRLGAAKTWLDGSEDYSVRHTYLVWLQGETDGDNGVTAERYTKTLDKIFQAFHDDAGVEQCFVIPIGTYNGSNAVRQDRYEVIRQAQIDYCEGSDLAAVISVRTIDLYEYGMMKDEFHFTQAGYEILGEDAGANMASFVKTGEDPVCTHYFPLDDLELKEGGAWKAAGGRVVIPAVAALENSVYAAASSYYKDGALYSWELTGGALWGVRLLPDNGKQWNTGTGYLNAPQLNFQFYIDTPGTYYLYCLTSHPDTGGNSYMACVDGGALIDCAPPSYEPGLWQSDKSWKFEIAEAGEHTLTICGREDGLVLNQIVLSMSADESFEKGVTLEESDRMPIVEQGAYVEVNGTVCIDLYSAFEQSAACSYENGTHPDSTTQYYWERSTNGRGVQIMPDDELDWGDDYDVAPKLTYRVEFNTTGTYYVYLYSSFADMQSDSAAISVDNGPIVELAQTVSSSGSHRWSVNFTKWKLEVTTPGVHTITVYARESGAAMHTIYLSKSDADCVGANDPAVSPRLSVGEDAEFAEQGGYAFAEPDRSASVTFAKTGTYTVYALAKDSGELSLTLGGTTERVQATGGAWVNCGEFTVAQAGAYELSFGGVGAKYAYAVHADNLLVEGVETLVFGDSYTSKTYWTQFDSQMSDIGALTIGVSGSEVSNWTGRVSEFRLYNPKNIVVHIGVNDINRNRGTGEKVGESIVALLESIREMFPEAKIFYVSICHNKSNTSKWSEYDASNATVKEYIDRTQGLYYIDYASKLEEVKGTLQNGGFRSDNLHPSEQAYEIFSQLIVDEVRKANEA